MKQTTVRRARNVETKKAMKSAVREFNEKPSAKNLQAAQSEIDTAVKKNVLNKGTAARRKSQLVKIAKAAGVKPAVSSKKKTTTAKAKPATAAKKAVVKAPVAKKPAVKAVAAKKATPAKKAPVKKAPAKKPAAKK